MSDFYKCKPSEIIHLTDEYTAFCFDETCMYISLKMQNGEKPSWKSENQTSDKSVKKPQTPKDVYSKFMN